LDPRLDFRAAAKLYAEARREGRTVRSLIDCLIASVAIRHDVRLLHKDVDYYVISKISPLQIHTGLRQR
jgi:predicted nucleic acid-binding protein